MDFLTFFTYFCISYFTCTFVLYLSYYLYVRKKSISYRDQLIQALKNNDIEVIQISEEDLDTWH